MNDVSLESVIRSHIPLPTTPNSTGWFPVLCKVCNDHGRKGPRAAFRFDHGSVGYHCFNCNAKGAFDPDKHRSFSQNLVDILQAFDVPEEDINRARFALLGNKPSEAPTTKTVSHEPKELPLPSHFYPATPNDTYTLEQQQWVEVATLYLEERGLNINDYPFMLSTGIPDLEGHPKETHKALIKQAQKWKGRVIVPIYKKEKLIFYIGRDMTDSKIKKYESPSAERESVLFGFDKIFEQTDKPLYIVEGVFDAMLIDGVAVLGNKLTDGQIYWLNRSNRTKVYIPDKYGDGHLGAEQAVANGWSVAFPDTGSCKDVGEAVDKYGMLYVLATLTQNTAKGLEAKTRIRLYCHDKRPNL